MPSLSGLFSAFMMMRIAEILWPEEKELPVISSLVLMGSVLWLGFCTALMFDLLLAFFALLAITGGLYIIEGKKGKGTVIMGAGLGLGILSKGPVVFVHTLPVLFLFPWWAKGIKEERSKTIVTCYCAAILIGIAVALTWIIPAVLAGGKEYANAILWGQTAHRVTSSFAHRRPIWWYLPWLPLFFCPWIFLVPTWRAFSLARYSGIVFGFCLSWIVSSFVIFSLFSGKQIYYLLPMLPAAALLISSGLSIQNGVGTCDILPFFIFVVLLGTLLILSPLLARSVNVEIGPNIGLAEGVVLFAFGALALILRPKRILTAVVAVLIGTAVSLMATEAVAVKAIGRRYDLTGTAVILKTYEEQGRPLAHVGKYHGQYHFLGRLKGPLQIINRGQIGAWLLSHPRGRVIAYYRHPPASGRWNYFYSQPYRGKTLVILGSAP